MPEDRPHYGPSPSRRKKIDEIWMQQGEDAHGAAGVVVTGALSGIITPSGGVQGITDHEAAVNPHPVYMTAAEVAAAQLGQHTITLHPPYLAASTPATNLAATTFSAIDDPNYRWMGDLRNLTKLRIMGRIGGSLVAATKLRVQYHTGGDPSVATGDGGWTTLATTAGSHTLNTLFYSAELTIPGGAQINNALIRVGLYDGDGAADPTISACLLNVYP